MAVRDRIVGATCDLLRRRGVAGTGVAEIMARSGVARRSIYVNFPGGKSELVDAATRWGGDRMARLLAEHGESADPVGSFVDAWARQMEDGDFEVGCPVVAAALGWSDAEAAAATAGEIFREWTRMLADRLVAGGIDAATATSLAVTVIAAVEGAVIIAQAERSVEPLRQVGARLTDLLALHGRGR